MNPEAIDILISIYKFEIITALYEQRIITQENYKEYLLANAGPFLDVKEEGNDGKT